MMKPEYIKEADYDKLRLILEKEHHRPFSKSETKEVGTHLIRLFELLAGDLRITKGGLKNKKRLKER